MGSDLIEVLVGYLLSPSDTQAFERHLDNIYPDLRTTGVYKATVYFTQKLEDLPANTEEERKSKEKISLCQVYGVSWPSPLPLRQVRAQHPNLKTGSDLRRYYAEEAEANRCFLFTTRTPIAFDYYQYERFGERFTEGPTEPERQETDEILPFFLRILHPRTDTDPPLTFVTKIWNKPDEESESDVESDILSDGLEGFGLREVADEQAADEDR